MNPLRRRLGAAAVVTVLAASALTACSSGSSTPNSAKELRLGYFPNVTHASALIGVKDGYFAKALGSTKLTTQTFNAGPAAVEALFGGSLDATYIGPNPSINAFIQSKGESVRIVSGATSGGASFVVQPSINSAADLKGKTVASPQLGGTQDVALRYWLKGQGLPTTPTGGGDVKISPTDNATTLQLFKDGKIAGAWVPEPWASRLVIEGGGKVLVDERTLWPAGRFVTTNLLVRTDYLEKNPDIIEALLKGQLAANAWIAKNPAQAKADANAQIEAVTTKSLPQKVLDRAWTQIAITDDPLARTLKESADHAVAVGVTKDANVQGIYDLTLLNQVLTAEKQKTVSASGLGKD